MPVKRSQARTAKPAAPKSPPQPLWSLIAAHLQATAGDRFVPLAGLVEALVEEGHVLGKYPLRTVKQCVASPHLRGVFEVEGPNRGQDQVRLKNTVQYLPYSYRSPLVQQAKQRPRST